MVSCCSMGFLFVSWFLGDMLFLAVFKGLFRDDVLGKQIQEMPWR